MLSSANHMTVTFDVRPVNMCCHVHEDLISVVIKDSLLSNRTPYVGAMTVCSRVSKRLADFL
jgi:hypothetical protein